MYIRLRRAFLALVLAPFAVTAEADPIVVAEFGFEGPMGQADPQGWRARHSNEDGDAYFHVDDFSGAGQQASPLAGSQSMWCGLAVEDPRTCTWGFPPGYGTNWRQNLSSIEFAVQGDVHLDFLVEISVEPAYDFVHVQYQDLLGDWQSLDSYSCTNLGCLALNQSYTVPAASHDGTIRFRFYLTSDLTGDAESIPFAANPPFGIAVDDLTVADDTGVVDFQDFEGEAFGAGITLDGDWFAEPNTDAYDGGILISGTQVLQESPTTNDTPLWGFFNGSTRDFGCAGHPEQLVVDETQSRIVSPLIDIAYDVDGHEILGPPDSLLIGFDVYRDIDPSESKSYTWMIRDFAGDCPFGFRQGSTGFAAGNQQDWYRQQFWWVPQEGTTHVEIWLGVNNADFAPEDCRSHAPLLDNVTVKRFGGVVTAVDNGPAPRLTLKQNEPNPFNPGTTIQFEVPAGPEGVALRIYDVSGRLVRTLVDKSLPAGTRSVYWNGRDDAGQSVASGVYYYELVVGDQRQSRRMLLLK
jgi:hypothetical protein